MNAPPPLNPRGQPLLHLGTSSRFQGAAIAKAALEFYPTDEDFPMSPTGKPMSPEEKRSHGKPSKLFKASLGGTPCSRSRSQSSPPQLALPCIWHLAGGRPEPKRVRHYFYEMPRSSR